MKKIIILHFVFVMVALASCSFNGCDHDWRAATCNEPKTCVLCGEKEGEAIPHNWSMATCTRPRTCFACNKTEGSVADHNWKSATCTAPQTCRDCGETRGSFGNHNWNAATCTSAKSCRNCSKTEGNPLGHTNGSTCSRCGEKLSNWIQGEYKDEFDMPTGENYIALYGTEGEFSNSATTDSDLAAVIQIDTDNIGIMLWEYGHSLVNGVFDSTSYSITILDANGTRHSFVGTMTRGSTRIYFRSADRARIMNILRQEGDIMVYLINSQYTVSTYLFNLDTKGFSEAYQSAGLR